MDRPDPFRYSDYRRLIQDYYRYRKSAESGYSYQKFAEDAGFQTKTFLFKVMRGEKALAGKSIGAVAAAMGLKKRETRYFEALVRFNEAGTIEEKQYCFARLQGFHPRHAHARLRGNQFSYFDQWYHPVVRELVTFGDFRGDYRELAARVRPAITPRQARKAVELLLDLGLIEKGADGRFRQTEKVLTTGDEVVSLAVQNFQKRTLRLAEQALGSVAPEERDVSTLTLGLSAQGFERLKENLRAFRKHLITVAEQDEACDRVIQVNLQAFPLSRTLRPRKRGSP